LARLEVPDADWTLAMQGTYTWLQRQRTSARQSSAPTAWRRSGVRAAGVASDYSC
jgi:hypothetical protein